MPQSWKITNAITSSINIVLLDAYTDEVTPKTFFYESKHLDLLRGTTPQDYVPFTKADTKNYETYALPAVHKDTANTSLDYTFIIANAQNLEPIALVSANSSGSDFTDLSVTDAIVTNMRNVADFVKDITAFPDSPLATGFTTALNTNDPAKVTAFFAACLNVNYQNLKLDDIHLVQSYLRALPYGWAPYNTNKYFLYATDYRNNTPTDEPIGELVITNDYADAGNPAKSNPITPAAVVPDAAKFKAVLTTYDTKDTSQSLVFKNGTFWDSITTDTPKTSLLGSFIMPSTLTMDNLRTEVERYFAGKVNGYDAFAVNEEAPHDQDDEGGFIELFHPQNTKEVLDLIMYFITIGMGIGFLVSSYYGFKFLKNKLKSDDDLDREAKAKELKDHMDRANEELIGKINTKIKHVDPQDLPLQQKLVKEKEIDFQTRLDKESVQKIVDSLDASITALANVYNVPALQDITDKLFEIQDTLNNKSLADFRQAVESGLLTDLDAYAATVRESKGHAGARLKGKELKDYEAAQVAIKDARERFEVEEEQEEKQEEAENKEEELGRKGKNKNENRESEFGGESSSNAPVVEMIK